MVLEIATAVKAAKALGTGVATLNKMGTLDRVKNSLINDKTGAKKHLSDVLEAIGGTFRIVEDTLVEFNSLSFKREEDQLKAKRFLEKVRGATIEDEMMKAKAHCSNINQVYDQHLKGWFSQRLKVKEQEEIDGLFKSLARDDDAWIEMVKGVAHHLQEISDELLTLMKGEHYKEAQKLQQDVETKFHKVQTDLGQGMVTLRKLQQDFK